MSAQGREVRRSVATPSLPGKPPQGWHPRIPGRRTGTDQGHAPAGGSQPHPWGHRRPSEDWRGVTPVFADGQCTPEHRNKIKKWHDRVSHTFLITAQSDTTWKTVASHGSCLWIYRCTNNKRYLWPCWKQSHSPRSLRKGSERESITPLRLPWACGTRWESSRTSLSDEE